MVYNHFGPEGCFVKDFGPYLTDKYHSFWGSVINFDDARADEVRNYFIENALFWAKEYHIDGLRLDAVHTMFDCSARHILQELTESYERLSEQHGRKYYLMSEGSIDDAKYVRPRDVGGHGFDTAWSDGFHHAVFSLLMNGKTPYDLDFGLVRHLAKAFNEGYIFSWQYCPSLKRRIGSSSRDLPAYRLIVFTHNHDTTGNRLCGERLSNLISFEALKLSAGILMIYPGIPLIFMGEEYGERAPFLYFVSHSDPQLIKSVIKGRISFFGNVDGHEWKSAPPNPQSPKTFRASRLSWDQARSGNGRVLWMLHKRLIGMRRTIPALADMDRRSVEASCIEEEKVLFVDRWCDESRVFGCFNFNADAVNVDVPFPDIRLHKTIDSADAGWRGPGPATPQTVEGRQRIMIPPHSFSLYLQGDEP
jgi:maltooligosyltrehalose trehalohydrolase